MVVSKLTVHFFVVQWFSLNRDNVGIKSIMFCEGLSGILNACDHVASNWFALNNSSKWEVRWMKSDIEAYCANFVEATRLWSELGDIPVDEDAENLDGDFIHFPKGTAVSDVWHWFEEKFNLSVAKDLMFVD